MQFYIESRGKQNFIVNNDKDMSVNLRVLPEDEIAKMSEGSLRLYRRKIKEIQKSVYDYGTPQAKKAIGYLYWAGKRASVKFRTSK